MAVLGDIRCIQEILATHILDQYNRNNYQAQILAQCAFTQLMICLKDLVIKADNEQLRLDTTVINKLDFTDLVVKIRDAACHIESQDNMIGKSRLIFAMETHPSGDISYGYGAFNIFYHTGIVPAFHELKTRLVALTDYPANFFE
jgi:hypothetical protein